MVHACIRNNYLSSLPHIGSLSTVGVALAGGMGHGQLVRPPVYCSGRDPRRRDPLHTAAGIASGPPRLISTPSWRYRFLFVTDEWDNTEAKCEPHGAEGPGLMQMPPSCDPLIRTMAESYKGEYEAAVDRLLSGPFSAATVDESLERWSGQLRELVAELYSKDAGFVATAARGHRCR